MTIGTQNDDHAAADGPLDEGQTADLADIFRLLGDPTRKIGNIPSQLLGSGVGHALQIR